MQTEPRISDDAKAVLRALATRKNVIVAGPPGTGKSRLLNEVRDAFRWKRGGVASNPTGVIPLPSATAPIPRWYPSPDRRGVRASFSTVFDQNTKYRDFMRGLVPRVNRAGEFTVTSGTLHRAAVHAVQPENASLVVVDEINRGPAVAAFGSALVGIESDKRLLSDGQPSSTTQYFEILGDEGENEEFALPADLYILAAMNEADTSVEPLDVAFLRRFHIYRLEPEIEVLRRHFGLALEPAILPPAPVEPAHHYEALVQAFEKINKLIVLGRGQAYQLGHGALMHQSADLTSLSDAQENVAVAWATLRAHIDEVFYGNTRAISDILRAETTDSVYSLRESTFAGQTVRRIDGPLRPSPKALYSLLVSISAE